MQKKALIAPQEPAKNERDPAMDDALNAHTVLRDSQKPWKKLTEEQKVAILTEIEAGDAKAAGRTPATIEISDQAPPEGAYRHERNGLITINRDCIAWPDVRVALLPLWAQQKVSEHATSAEFKSIKEKAEATNVHLFSNNSRSLNDRSLTSDTPQEPCHEKGKDSSSQLSHREAHADSDPSRKDALRHAAVRMHMFDQVAVSQEKDRAKPRHFAPGPDVSKRIDELGRQHGAELEKGM